MEGRELSEIVGAFALLTAYHFSSGGIPQEAPFKPVRHVPGPHR